MIRLCLSICVLSTTSFLYAQTNYTTIASGNWNDPAIWTPTPASGHPNILDGTIIINSLHEVTIPAGFGLSIDETLVNGTFILAASSQITLEDGPGTDLVISNSGKFIRGDLSIINQTARSTVSFLSDSQYDHQYTITEGSLIDANWDANSRIQITGYTSVPITFTSANWSKNLGHVVYDCQAQTTHVNMGGLVRSVSGDLLVNSTGSGLLELSTNENPIIDLTGNLEINGTSRVYFSTSGNSPGTIINIGGDFVFGSTDAFGSYMNQGGICSANIAGNFIMNAPGALLTTSTGSGEGTFNVAGNFLLESGTINATISRNGKQGNINFNGSAGNVHVFSNTGSIVGDMNYTVFNGNILRISGESPLMGGDASTFNLNGTLVVESVDPNGAIQTYSASAGNIRLNVRKYNAGSSIIYHNSTGSQAIGNGQPGSTGAGTTSILTTTIIDNVFGVSLNSSTSTVTIGGGLQIANGDLNIINNSLTVKGDIDVHGGNIFLDSSNPVTAAKTLRCDGTINLTGGQIHVISGVANGDNATLTINGDISGTNYFTFSGPNCRATIGGTAPIVLSRDFPVNTPLTLEQLTINRPGVTLIMPQDLMVGNPSNTSSGLTLTKGNLKMNGDLIVAVNAILTSGTLYFEDHTIELRRAITCTTQPLPLPSGMLSSNKNSILKITGNYSNATASNTLFFSSTGNVLATLVLDRSGVTALPHITLNSSLTISDYFYLTKGTFYNSSGLKFDTTAVVVRTPNASFYAGSVIPLGGPYNLIYSGTDIIPGLEAKGLLNDITTQLTGTITLTSPLSCTGTLFINSGVWNSGSNDMSVRTIINNGIFNAPNTTLQLQGDFINNNIFNHNNGTVVFSGNSSIAGTSNPLFNNLTISGTLTSPALLNLAGDFTNNGTFNKNNGLVTFTGSAIQKIMGTTVTDFNNLTVSNTAATGVSIETGQNLMGVLTLGVNSVFDADGSLDTATFTLVSQNDAPANDASVATLPAGASVNGNVKVQRFMHGENRIYRYLSSPTSNGTVADWMDDFPVTGDFKDRSAYPKWPKTICGFPLGSAIASLYYYDETQNGAAGGYVAYPKPNTFSYNSKLDVGKGYVPFIRECASPTIIDISGPVNQGTISIPVTYTNTHADTLSFIGWNLVGNPYPSAIDWNQDGDLNGNGSHDDVVDGWSKTNIAATIAIRDNGTGTVRYWDGDADDSLKAIVNGIIASGQGFWVRTIGANPQLIIREGVKSLSSSEFFRKQTVPAVVITLKSDSFEDRAYIKVRTAAKQGLDYWDAPKIDNAVFSLSTLSTDKITMAINAVPEIKCGLSFKLNMTGLVKGSYTMVFSNRGDFDRQMIVVHDKFLKTVKNISWGTPLVFAVTTDVASQAADRFTIEISDDQPAQITAEVPSPLCKDGHSQVTITNPQNDVIYSAWSADGNKLSIDYPGRSTSFSIPLTFHLGQNNVLLKGQTNCGTYEVSSILSVLYENPSIDQVQGDSTCLAGSVNLLAASLVSGATYSWYETSNDVTPIYEGQVFTTPVLRASKIYFVSARTSLGCEGEKVDVKATIIQYEAPVITAEANVLRNSYTDHVQWYLNDKAIVGGIGATIEAKASGLYSAITNIQGCEARADYQFDYLVTGVENMNAGLAVYPNPVKDVLYVTLPLSESYLGSYWVNNFGVSLDIKPAISGDKHITFDIKRLPDGIYLLKFKSSCALYSFKIIKCN